MSKCKHYFVYLDESHSICNKCDAVVSSVPEPTYEQLQAKCAELERQVAEAQQTIAAQQQQIAVYREALEIKCLYFGQTENDRKALAQPFDTRTIGE